MIIDFTDAELKARQALEDSYEKLLAEAEEEIYRLRPDDPEPDEEEYRRLQASRPKAPPLPEPIEIRDGKPVFRKSDMDAYYSSAEYVAYNEETKRINDAVGKLYDDWYAAGSEEWKAARKRYDKLERELVQAREDFYRRAEKRQFSMLGDDPKAILEDAFNQVDRLIVSSYNHYDKLRAGGSFSAFDVRLQDDGLFRLDTTETRRNLLRALQLHINALPEEDVEELYAYIDRALASSPFVSDDGVLGAMVEQVTRPDDTTEKGLSVNRPREYRRPNTKAHNLLFANELTTDDRNYFEPIGLNKSKNVLVYANFLPPQAAAALGLDDFDERVYAAVGSCLFAGNNFIPFSMLYNRGVLGLSPKERGRDITANIESDLIESLSLFDGRITLTNDPTGELKKADPDFKEVVINEPLLFYQIRQETVHGQVTRGIAIPSGYIPVGYRYGELNGNEILTDRIESIHVAGLNYSRDNIIVANATFKRVKEIQYHNDQKRYKHEIPENKRTITYEYIAERVLAKQNRAEAERAKRAGEDFTPRTYADLSQTERSRLKSKIDRCMKSYQASGLFDRYEHKRDKTKTYYAVVLYFESEPKKLT